MTRRQLCALSMWGLVSLFAVRSSGAQNERALASTDSTGRLVPLDSVTFSYKVGDIRVIQRPNFANDVVAVNLYLLGGTRQLTAATQGIEPLILYTSEYGTAKYPKEAARRALAKTGSYLEIDASSDWTLYGFRSIRQEFDSTWSVFADRLMHPTLSANDVGIVRTRMIAALRQRMKNPDGYISFVADSIAYPNHPYALHPDGTESSLSALDSATLSNYVAQQVVTSRMLFVVVGNVKREQVEAALTKTFATLPKGSYTWTLPSPLPPAKSSVAMIHRMMPSDYILGYFDGPPASEKDYSAFRVATALLSSELSSAIRGAEGLSYAAHAPFVERGISAGGVYVSTRHPARVMTIVKAEVDTVRSMAFYGLRYFTDQFIMDYFAANMTSAAQADFLARAELYRGDYHRATQAMEDLRSVDLSDVKTAARKYFKNFRFVYLGDTAVVKQAAFTSF